MSIAIETQPKITIDGVDYQALKDMAEMARRYMLEKKQDGLTDFPAERASQVVNLISQVHGHGAIR